MSHAVNDALTFGLSQLLKFQSLFSFQIDEQTAECIQHKCTQNQRVDEYSTINSIASS